MITRLSNSNHQSLNISNSTFLFVRYSRRTSSYSEKISLSNLTYMMSMVDLIVISVEILRIDSGCSLKKELIELVRMNP